MKVAPKLGDGQNTETNLYWGAAYGVRTYLTHAGWTVRTRERTPAPGMLERVKFTRTTARRGRQVPIVLACASKPYFEGHLMKGGSHPLLLTTGLMAPEAYVLDAALRAWASGEPADRVRESAASAYDHFQKCGIKAARRLFTGSP